VLVRVLNGRTDLEMQGTPFAPPERRYIITNASPAVTQLKVKIIKALKDFTSIRTNFRLGNALQLFKTLATDARSRSELERCGAVLAAQRAGGAAAGSYEGPLVAQLFDEFEALFVKGDGLTLMIDQLSGENVDNILLDCLM